ncbi:D-alanyl-D-alanine carboxypeptidase family protein [Gottschalkiaceae bacterium SANA]|nr:D-alanyl-D-alanine carboxypeptidase family protein [Gottschalkiaceae bacterium SANA]
MKRILTTLLILTLTCPIFSTGFALTEPEIDSPAAILVDLESGSTLYEKNADKVMYPASITKILSAIVVLEYFQLDELVTVDKNSPYEVGDSTHIALEPGEVLTVDQLLHAGLIRSANDAMKVLARAVAGSEPAFAELMNEKALELGASQTHFVNATGLPDENHVTTAADMAKIAAYAMTIPEFAAIVQTPYYKIPPTNIKENERYFETTNKLLFSPGKRISYHGSSIPIKYPGTIGMKTGYTSQAKNTLVAAAENGDAKLLLVILNTSGSNLYIDAHTLLDFGFENFKKRNVCVANEYITQIPILSGDRPDLAAIVKSTVALPFSTDRDPIFGKIVIPAENLEAPVHKGDEVGKVEYYFEDQLIARVSLIAATDVRFIGKVTTLMDQKPIPTAVLISAGVIGLFAIVLLFGQAMRLRNQRMRKKRRLALNEQRKKENMQ